MPRKWNPWRRTGHEGAESSRGTHDCGGEPCDAVFRGLLAFFDRRLEGLAANGRACADCHMATDSFQLSPANVEARFQFLQRRRRRNPDADDPLFRPIDADDFRINGENASDFSNLRQNGLVRITFPLPSNIWLIDPATNLPSLGGVRGRVAERADGERCRAHRTRHMAFCGRAARTKPVATSWTPESRRCRNRPSAPSPITRRCRARRRNGCSTICRRFSGCCSRTIVFAPCRTPSGKGQCRCRIPIPGSRRSNNRVKRYSSARARSATAGPASRPPRRRRRRPRRQ